MKILLVEDNDMNRIVISRQLMRKGFDIVEATDGQAGIDLAFSEQPDLVLMDLSLPILDGLDAVAHIRANENTADLPIIALTASDDDADRERAISAGCDDFDTKPVEIERLLEKINDLVPS